MHNRYFIELYDGKKWSRLPGYIFIDFHEALDFATRKVSEGDAIKAKVIDECYKHDLVLVETTEDESKRCYKKYKVILNCTIEVDDIKAYSKREAVHEANSWVINMLRHGSIEEKEWHCKSVVEVDND